MTRFTLLITRGKDVACYGYDTLDRLAAEVYRMRWLDEGKVVAAGALPWSMHIWKGGEYSRLRPFNVEAFDGMSVLDVAELYRHGANLHARYSPSWYRSQRAYWDGEGPVPGTGRRVRYGRHWLRSPQTQHDRRESCRPLDIDEPKVRAKRNHHYLPSAWSDMSRVKPRSWKNHGKRHKAWAR